MVPRLLDALDFRSNNAVHRPVIEALALVRRYAGHQAAPPPRATRTVPIDGVVRGLWREAVIETGRRGAGRGSTGSPTRSASWRRCASGCAARRSGWSAPTATATRTRTCRPTSPSAARPTTRRSACRSTPTRSSPACRRRCARAWPRLDAGLPRNPHVRITSRRGGWITVSPLRAAARPGEPRARSRPRSRRPGR